MSWLIDREVWHQIYTYIRGRLKLSFDLDQKATDILSSILDSMPNTVEVDHLKRITLNRRVFVLGPAPSIDRDFRRAEALGLLHGCALISVDGASSYLYEIGVVPDIIVTDLDGNPQHIAYLNSRGSTAIVHGHGDNIDEVVLWVQKLSGPVIGSTQAEPRPHVYNFGGFTDGDRALYIAYALGVREVFLGGMDFCGEIGAYSIAYKKKDVEVKRAKMNIAVELVEMLVRWGMKIKSLSRTCVPGVEVV